MYRKDLMEKAGLKMPEKPTWEFIKQAADKMTDKAAGVYGICLRGKPGWGENMAFLTAMSNSFGARWFDEKWQPQFNTPEWKATLDYYVRAAEGRRPSRRFVERLQREPCPVQRRQVRHVDRRHRRRRVLSPIPRIRKSPTRSASRLRRQWPRQARQLALGVVAGGARRLERRSDAAQKFISWATEQALRRSRRREGGLGAAFLRERAPRSTRTRII